MVDPVSFRAISHYYLLTYPLLFPSVLLANVGLCCILVTRYCLHRRVSRFGISGSCSRGSVCRARVQSGPDIQRRHQPQPLSTACGGVGAPRLQRPCPHQVWSLRSPRSP